MKALKTILALLLAAAIVALSAYAADDTPEVTPAPPLVLDTSPAMRVAENWLGLIDTGRYGQSWDEGSSLFRESVPKLEWEKALDRARGPLGVTNARRLRSAIYTRSLPGAPEGEYVVIQFDTRFEGRPLSTETVTPMRDKDGQWRVAGYDIK